MFKQEIARSLDLLFYQSFRLIWFVGSRHDHQKSAEQLCETKDTKHCQEALRMALHYEEIVWGPKYIARAEKQAVFFRWQGIWQYPSITVDQKLYAFCVWKANTFFLFLIYVIL